MADSAPPGRQPPHGNLGWDQKKLVPMRDPHNFSCLKN